MPDTAFHNLVLVALTWRHPFRLHKCCTPTLFYVHPNGCITKSLSTRRLPAAAVCLPASASPVPLVRFQSSLFCALTPLSLPSPSIPPPPARHPAPFPLPPPPHKTTTWAVPSWPP